MSIRHRAPEDVWIIGDNLWSVANNLLQLMEPKKTIKLPKGVYV